MTEEDHACLNFVLKWKEQWVADACTNIIVILAKPRNLHTVEIYRMTFGDKPSSVESTSTQIARGVPPNKIYTHSLIFQHLIFPNKLANCTR